MTLISDILKLRNCILALLLCMGGNALAQQNPDSITQNSLGEIQFSIDGDFHFFTTDNLLNVYGLNQKDELLLYNRKGELMFRYSNKRYGKPSYLDASNPFKLLLFFPEYGVVTVLDNRLTEMAVIEFLKLGYDRVNSVCLAEDNNIWFYDELDFRLKKLDETLRVVYQSESLNNILGIGLRPARMVMRNKWLYLNDTHHGIFVFDLFGTYYNTLEFKAVSNFQLYGDQLIFQRDSIFSMFNLRTLESHSLALPAGQTIGIRLEKDRLFRQTKVGIEVYPILSAVKQH